MQTKYKYIIAGALTAIAFLVGRYTGPTKTITVVKTVEVKVKDTTTDTTKDTDKVTVIVKAPDGSTTTTITDKSKIVRDTDTHESDTTKTASKTVTERSSGTLNISALAGLQPHLTGGVSLGPIVYGASITKQIIGPITAGVWGISNLTFGASLGWTFP